MLQRLSHPNLVRIVELCEDRHYIYEVAELVKHGDLMQVIENEFEAGGALSEAQVGRWILQILEGLNYLHA